MTYATLLPPAPVVGLRKAFDSSTARYAAVRVHDDGDILAIVCERFDGGGDSGDIRGEVLLNVSNRDRGEGYAVCFVPR